MVRDVKLVRDVVVLDRGVALHDVAALAAHVQVDDLASGGHRLCRVHLRGSIEWCCQHTGSGTKANRRGFEHAGDRGRDLLDEEDVRAVLERAPELVGVHRQLQAVVILCATHSTSGLAGKS